MFYFRDEKGMKCNSGVFVMSCSFFQVFESLFLNVLKKEESENSTIFKVKWGGGVSYVYFKCLLTSKSENLQIHIHTHTQVNIVFLV